MYLCQYVYMHVCLEEISKKKGEQDAELLERAIDTERERERARESESGGGGRGRGRERQQNNRNHDNVSGLPFQPANSIKFRNCPCHFLSRCVFVFLL